MSNLKVPAGSQSGHRIIYRKGPPIFFLMMRFNIKIALVFMVSISLITMIVLYSVCNETSLNSQSVSSLNGKDFRLLNSEDIDCDINGEYVINCRKEADEIYVPFTFLHSYFEVYGKLAVYEGTEKFEWSHSYSRVYHPKSKYDSRGIFMYFENYNVEVRDRVKCISGIEAVPVSTQWESQGYYYPTQIAQFGLSHYSKNLTEPDPRRKVIEDGNSHLANWMVPPFANLKRTWDKSANKNVLQFRTSEDYRGGIELRMDHVLDLVLSLNVLLQGNSSFTVVLQNRETKEEYRLHYIVSDILIATQGLNIYHGIGSTPKWKRLTRDLVVDLQKGLGYVSKDKSKPKFPRSKFKVVNIILRGSGALNNLTFSSSEHIQQFYDSAEWFVNYQDLDTGGWPIPVKRKLASGFEVLQPGWYSAMGQGHALSVLSRAYYHSGGDQRYLNAAINGLKPFRVPSSEGGVLATFLNKFHWYEEYPTKPASFVLNGFIYSLLGLYDLLKIAPILEAQEAEFLYSEGIETLKHMISLFDMGSVTSYDLRHFTLSIAPNLARWDYHATHVNQLLLLATIETDPIFNQTAERWLGYMNGKRADHN
ncbi:D-glucuronyl C5-epimerase isoform X2 [Cylas formicarius]|uniref:D-glucuronyl C5-epimerase isoform X2 n=1 Tax=Cylas formicarius TaxID=197179 RepID=UPI0029584803|nr:D-glucuronyl C5-epimerase isoform X2 [Cylas formicarius]